MTDEQRERLKQIRERLTAHQIEATKYHSHEWAKGNALHYHEAPDDIEFLLSLLDSQATGSNAARMVAETIAADLGYQGGTQNQRALAATIETALDNFTTAMRSRCVEKVRGLMEYEVNGHRQGAFLDAVIAIESLLLDQAEQKQ